MPVIAVVGSQWGDEAKGKFVDLLSRDASIVARFNGGDNAGHTVVNQFGTFKLRLTPNGFANPQAKCVIGPGVVVNLNTLAEEVESIQSSGINLGSRLWISPRCHVIMPWHPVMEEIFENARGTARTGTTRRGISPVYADKVSYNGIRLFDLLYPGQLREKVRIQLAIKNPIFRAFDKQELDPDSVVEQTLENFAPLSEFVREPFELLQDALSAKQIVLLEGAQGALLDNNWGTYPYCTASITTAGGAPAGLGIAPQLIERVIGIVKAYTTRVGEGPMPTELFDDTAMILQERGNEFGTVTGRPRRCGWFDAALVSFSSKLNGATELALTKLDVLDSLPEIQICTSYRRGDTENITYNYWDGDAHWLETCQPQYVTLPGWQKDTSRTTRFQDLPDNARSYVEKIEQLTGVPVRFISVGPDRSETIIRD
jgi:adenylosuccinate synthase